MRTEKRVIRGGRQRAAGSCCPKRRRERPMPLGARWPARVGWLRTSCNMCEMSKKCCNNLVPHSNKRLNVNQQVFLRLCL